MMKLNGYPGKDAELERARALRRVEEIYRLSDMICASRAGDEEDDQLLKHCLQSQIRGLETAPGGVSDCSTEFSCLLSLLMIRKGTIT